MKYIINSVQVTEEEFRAKEKELGLEHETGGFFINGVQGEILPDTENYPDDIENFDDYE